MENPFNLSSCDFNRYYPSQKAAVLWAPVYAFPVYATAVFLLSNYLELIDMSTLFFPQFRVPVLGLQVGGILDEAYPRVITFIIAALVLHHGINTTTLFIAHCRLLILSRSLVIRKSSINALLDKSHQLTCINYVLMIISVASILLLFNTDNPEYQNKWKKELYAKYRLEFIWCPSYFVMDPTVWEFITMLSVAGSVTVLFAVVFVICSLTTIAIVQSAKDTMSVQSVRYHMQVVVTFLISCAIQAFFVVLPVIHILFCVYFEFFKVYTGDYLFYSLFTQAHQGTAFTLFYVLFHRKTRKTLTKYQSLRETGVAQNVTTLLNNVLKNYDQHFRPGFKSGKPTKVYIDLFIRTMGPVADLAYTYSFNCYFRQKWTDDRLHFNNSGIGFRQLSLSMAMLDKIWKPDTYFWNGAGSYVHGITTSNRLVRLEPDGTILYSSRITIKAKCQMDMSRYPLDKQACRLVLGSYAYPSDEVQYKWRIMDNDKGVKIDYESIADLPQFSLTGFKVYDPANLTRDKEYSALEVRFYFDRHFGYFLMNFYVPCALVVLLCWVAFFTKREATAERIGIGITNVLTIVLISLDSKSDSPKVDSPTALDVYIWICYLTHLFCMIEFTVVHYYTKYNTGDPEIQEVERERLRQIIKQIPKNSNSRVAVPSFKRRNAAQPVSITRSLPNKAIRFMSVRQPRRTEQRESIQLMRKISHMETSTQNEAGSSLNLESIRQENVGWRLYYWMIDHDIKTDPFGVAQNSISRIDKISVVVAPLIFILTIALYYDFYVNRPFKFKFENDFRNI
ncbi:unnamed protein product [Caenorhabditis sp. 36 PRJEB53466]|nr:unnamed protein product [Caenorhabditis sp. 36 PRJEB53466]